MVWGLAYVVVVLLPSVLAIMLVGGWMENEGSVDLGTLLLSQSLSSLSTIGSSLLAVILASAVCRALLQPGESSRWYLRLGTQELWVGLVWFVIVMALAFAAVLLLSPLLFVTISAAAGADLQMAIFSLMFVFGVAVVAVLVWVAIRFSLAVPMSFERKTFVLLESWAMTRGHAWRIFLAYAGAGALFLILEVLALAAFMAVAAGIALLYGVRNRLGLDEVLAQPPMDLLLLVAPLGLIVITVLNAISYPITIAPMVTIYRRLSDAQTPRQA